MTVITLIKNWHLFCLYCSKNEQNGYLRCSRYRRCFCNVSNSEAWRFCLQCHFLTAIAQLASRVSPRTVSPWLNARLFSWELFKNFDEKNNHPKVKVQLVPMAYKKRSSMSIYSSIQRSTDAFLNKTRFYTLISLPSTGPRLWGTFECSYFTLTRISKAPHLCSLLCSTH